MKKYTYIIVLIFSFLLPNLSFSNDTLILDFTKVLNESKAGKEAQEFLKNKLQREINKFNEQEQKLREEEKSLINQKKVISQEEYQKKVDELRGKVADLQNNRKKSLESISKTRIEARKKLLQNLNPILENYMKEKNVKLILDKDVILVSQKELEITDIIIQQLNSSLKSLNLK